ncbi:hypothetical protein MTR67_040514 [Solanum verrucosum]|uniref:Uncharacterized protein n=1 Tax=Solanum verrucosum TaxID=315347 RepID=A0AAF0UKX9_SOLVR|nr:hypothetical protein MTR67_040514 [Solanum verrucosum]
MFSLLLSNPTQVHCLMLLGETMILSRSAPLITCYRFVKLERTNQSKLSQDISLKGLLTLPLQNGINAIKWDPSGSLLASRSDDTI